MTSEKKIQNELTTESHPLGREITNLLSGNFAQFNKMCVGHCARDAKTQPSHYQGSPRLGGNNKQRMVTWCATAKPEVCTDQRVQERFLKEVISELTLKGQAGVSQVEKRATGRINNTRKDPMANLCLDTEANATLHKLQGSFRGVWRLAYLQIQPSMTPTKCHLP